MIVNSVRAQYGRPLQTSFMYSKSYTKGINNLRMSLGYQPPKFQQFDGKGNPKQHIAHFIETCETAESREDQLFRKDKKETKGAEKIVKSFVKESMIVNITPLKFSKRKEVRAEKKDDGTREDV
ncbi:ty3-gypsy retrotransposon protein [Cucumis melo var. makuwa]|uniref:Ty3-gypsy retrotransposon protein n=1 Tax=Cucumis melo var. makuwa TaxID=1194695 RepID=A0A5A7SJI8_CUCMM|nr:ty3-gypsy retrotransposon protein [Cucumis melo var. makuwa]TYK06475.1 ty3-gypsy retrotransposon protein [Cucumis melo var. makuwa]